MGTLGQGDERWPYKKARTSRGEEGRGKRGDREGRPYREVGKIYIHTSRQKERHPLLLSMYPPLVERRTRSTCSHVLVVVVVVVAAAAAAGTAVPRRTSGPPPPLDVAFLYRTFSTCPPKGALPDGLRSEDRSVAKLGPVLHERRFVQQIEEGRRRWTWYRSRLSSSLGPPLLYPPASLPLSDHDFMAVMHMAATRRGWLLGGFKRVGKYYDTQRKTPTHPTDIRSPHTAARQSSRHR